jgi:regulator of sigma E protease
MNSLLSFILDLIQNLRHFVFDNVLFEILAEKIFPFLLVLGVLVFVHEFGHFLFAKLFGVRVLKFSLGFGNKLISRKWGDTEYLISAFPLGGYVKMYGEQPDEKVAEDQKIFSFSHKTVGQRFGIIFGGPLFNLIFAVCIFWFMFMVVEMPKPMPPLIETVSAGSAAEKAGLKSGDLILKINGLSLDSWVQVSTVVNGSKGKETLLSIQRDNEILIIKAIPVLTKITASDGEMTDRYLLGISNSNPVSFEEKKTPLEALPAAFHETWNLTRQTFEGIAMMFKGLISASELGGPIRIAEIAGQQMKAGWRNLLYFTGLLSINLGVLNLLPIPVLDGGHLVFLSIEAVRRKSLNETIMIRAQQVGIALLGSLMIFVFYNDIDKIVRRLWAAS